MALSQSEEDFREHDAFWHSEAGGGWVKEELAQLDAAFASIKAITYSSTGTHAQHSTFKAASVLSRSTLVASSGGARACAASSPANAVPWSTQATSHLPHLLQSLQAVMRPLQEDLLRRLAAERRRIDMCATSGTWMCLAYTRLLRAKCCP